MKSINYYILLTIGLLTTISCEDVIEWDVEEDETRLVVEGRITNELLRHQIILTETADFFNPDGPTPVTGAQVSVSDGSRTFDFIENESGVYQVDEPFAGVIGNTYTLNITLLSSLGGSTTFTASSDLSRTLHIDDVFGTIEEGDDFFLIGFNGLEPEGLGDYYLFELLREEELFTDSIDEVISVDDEFIDGIEFNDFIIFDIDEEDLQLNDEITMKVYSIDEQYFDYLQAINLELEGDPLGFNGPSANPNGNISSGALGYFYASAVVSGTSTLEVEGGG